MTDEVPSSDDTEIIFQQDKIFGVLFLQFFARSAEQLIEGFRVAL